jgi:putative acetyltransferase
VPEWELRAEAPADAAAIAGLHTTAFGDHGRAVSALVEELRATTPPGACASLVAVEDTELIGHVLFTPAVIDAALRQVEAQVLSPLAVAAAHRRRGVGTSLAERGIEVLVERDVPAVFLEGDPSYYARIGFVAAGPLGFRKPSLRIPDAAFQVRTLPAYAPWMIGTLVYPDAFWRHDAVGLRGSDGAP